MVEDNGRSYVSPAQAAERLGVSRRRIYDLAKTDRLEAVGIGGRLLIATDSLDALAAAGDRVGRPLSPRRAWGLILLASGEDLRVLDPVTRSKLRRMARERDLWSMRSRFSGRATRHDLRAHPSDLRRIDAEPEVVRTGPLVAAEAGLALVAADAPPEFYVDTATATRLATKYRLMPSTDPNVVLRVVPDEVWPWLSRSVAPAVAVALDVAESRDARSRDAVRAVLAR
ncbi:MAG: helix-turn-helix domain-containing protein [Chloroflexota bacterium]